MPTFVVMKAKRTIVCHVCGRDVSVRADKIIRHNKMFRWGYGHRRYVSNQPCPGAGAEALPIELERAEGELSAAVKSEESAQKALRDAEAALRDARVRVEKARENIAALTAMRPAKKAGSL